MADGTGRQADVRTLPTEQGTSEESPAYTKSQLDKAVNDALAAAGRDAKRIGLMMKGAEDMKREAETRLQKAEEAEVARLQDDPDALSAYRLRQQAAKDRVEAEHLRKEAEEARAEVATSRQEKEAIRIAAREDVDPTDLLTLTDGTTEKMEALAKKLPKTGSPEPKPKLRTETGITSGGGGLKSFTISEVKELQSKIANEDDPLKREKLVRELDEAWRGDRIKND